MANLFDDILIENKLEPFLKDDEGKSQWAVVEKLLQKRCERLVEEAVTEAKRELSEKAEDDAEYATKEIRRLLKANYELHAEFDVVRDAYSQLQQDNAALHTANVDLHKRNDNLNQKIKHEHSARAQQLREYLLPDSESAKAKQVEIARLQKESDDCRDNLASCKNSKANVLAESLEHKDATARDLQSRIDSLLQSLRSKDDVIRDRDGTLEALQYQHDLLLDEYASQKKQTQEAEARTRAQIAERKTLRDQAAPPLQQAKIVPQHNDAQTIAQLQRIMNYLQILRVPTTVENDPI
jgi:predicted nuclease with TOPRIM domain